MTRTPLWQTILIVIVVLFCSYYAAGNLIPQNSGVTEQSESFGVPTRTLNLGLDLQGGQYVQIEIDRQDAVASELGNMRLVARQFAAERNFRIRFRSIAPSEEIVGGLQVRMQDEGAAGLMLQELQARVPTLSTGNLGFEIPLYDITVVDTNVEIRMSVDAAQAFYRDLSARTVEQFRNRIDAFGLTEPTITTQGEDRVVVQIPGSAIEIDDLTSVGELKFIIVSNLPTSVEYPYPELGEGATIPLDEVRSIDGKNLVDASGAVNDQSPTGAFLINFRFNQPGGIELCNLTSDNLFEQMAIVFDGVVLSAPTIQSPICTGGGQITGDFDREEAETLATLMQSGALPAKVSVLDARTVGPTLGADSIAAGTTAGMIALIAVLVFMILAYGLFGIFANMALAINVAMLLGVLTMLGATLTLPGIAGIILTVGMAVDANVLVFERIREELRRGMSVGGAIDAGYKAAMSTIIDANLTTFIASLTLAVIGEGPVRGFAITLGIGIMTSMFTALLVTRGFISLWHGKNGPTKAPI